MYKRKIENILTQWKSSPHRKPIVIKGCRQCGKTSSVLDFAHKNYSHVIYLDFHEHREYLAFFTGSLDVDTLTFNISAGMPDAQFQPGETCLIFDEIQDCPSARSSLKFFHRDGRDMYRITAGSEWIQITTGTERPTAGINPGRF